MVTPGIIKPRLYSVNDTPPICLCSRFYVLLNKYQLFCLLDFEHFQIDLIPVTYQRRQLKSFLYLRLLRLLFRWWETKNRVRLKDCTAAAQYRNGGR